MVKPENRSRIFLILPVAFLLSNLLACSGSGNDCEADPNGEACGVAGTPAATTVVSTQGANTGLPWCLTALSDDDGDGYGFENGASCLVGGDLNSNARITVADINHVVVVTGQSNVAAPETTFDPELDKPNERVFAYTNEGWRVADLHQVWDENAHPGNFSLTIPERSPNNNFVFHFGKSLANLRPNSVTAFIVLADPGKGIANWDYDSPFYLKMRSKITTALSQIPHRDTIDVMLWHQGESDSLYEGTSDPDATGFTDKDSYEYKKYYEIKLRNVIANFRSELWSTPDMPFICGELRVAKNVSRHLMALNYNSDPNSACVPSADLPYRLSDPSGAHYSAAGLRELGRRYMQKYLQITNR